MPKQLERASQRFSDHDRDLTLRYQRQRNGVAVLFRQVGTWLQAWHEPTIVGAAVALFGLAYLFPIAPHPNDATQTDVSSFDAQPTAFAQGLYDIPQDDQFYRDKWIAEANAFYSANPPKNVDAQAAPSLVITASARTPVEPSHAVSSNLQPLDAPSPEIAVAEPNVVQATQSSPTGPQTVMALPAHAQRWRVLTCLAAGLLASLLFVSVWPANRSSDQRPIINDPTLELVGRVDAIPVRIPSAWIGLRPTWRQTARRGVMSASYLIAALGAWGIIS
jgi:hypothetical protein